MSTPGELALDVITDDVVGAAAGSTLVLGTTTPIAASWMCSFDTTEDDIDRFAAAIRREVGAG